jgi:hypothetical protein
MSEKRESIACEASLLEGPPVRRTLNGWASVDLRGAKSRSSSFRCGCAAGWLGVLDMLRWAVHDGDMRRIWQSGVRVSGDGRSRSSPSDRELMIVYSQGWWAVGDADWSRNGNWSEVRLRDSCMLRVPKICLPSTGHFVVTAQDIRSRTSTTLPTRDFGSLYPFLGIIRTLINRTSCTITLVRPRHSQNERC